MKKVFSRNYFWKLTVSSVSSDSDKDIGTQTQTLTLTADMMEILLLLAVQVGTMVMFGQDHSTVCILVMSILLLEVPVD